ARDEAAAGEAAHRAGQERDGDMRGDRDEPPPPALRLRPGAGARAPSRRAHPDRGGRGRAAPAQHGVVRARHRVSAAGGLARGEGVPREARRGHKEQEEFPLYPRAVWRTGLTTSGHPDIFRTRIFPETRLMPPPTRGSASWTKPGF